MPEIKNTFQKGVMNKDLDERIVPNGQYRDAMNVQVSTSESSEVGTVQNILGNTRVEDVVRSINLAGNVIKNFKCIGAIADEKNDVLYWFVTGLRNIGAASVDAIIEYHRDGTTTPILVDTKANTADAVLKFQPYNNPLPLEDTKTTTGISIIDNLLFWTDNVNEPRKINIDTLKLNAHTDLQTHSSMFINDVSIGDITENHITVIRKKPYRAPKIKLGDTILQSTYEFGDLGFTAIDISDGTGQLPLVGDPLTFQHQSSTNYFDPFEYQVNDIILFSRQTAIGNLPQNYELKLKVTSILLDTFVGGTGYVTIEFEILEIVSGIPVNQSFMYNAQKLTEDDALFKTNFIRFGTRYKYADGEYSAFSPFTQPVFLTGSYGFHPTKNSHNIGMENKIINLKLQELISNDVPDDVVQLDILFKRDESTTVYSIDSIKPNDPDIPGTSYNNWNKPMFVKVLSDDYVAGTASSSSHINSSTTHTGEYSITTENIYAALPANQMLRPWDNVPRKALSQEITANRLVYGNYIQNYNLVDFQNNQCYVDLELDYEVRGFPSDNVFFQNETLDFSSGKKSIKSDRTYYLGIVYGDEYGRETPVFTGKESSIKIPFDLDSSSMFNGAASNSLRLKARLQGFQPEWAYYYKYFIKQTTGEYYNLVVDRVYKSVQDQSLWLSIPSSDRNKLQEGDYFTIKKQVNVETQVPVENKIKVIDIKSESPESIKFDYTTLGTGGGGSEDLLALFPDSNGRPAEDVVRLAIDKEVWIETEFGANLDDYTHSDKFAVQFYITQNGSKTLSEMYFVSTAYEEDAGEGGRYVFLLRKKITAADSWVESSPGILNSDDRLTFELFVLQDKNAVEFEGRFFVKVASNPITQTYLIPEANNTVDYALTARAYTYWLADNNTTGNITGGTSGIYNVTAPGWAANPTYPGVPGFGNTAALTGSAYTDLEEEWAKVLKFDTDAESSSGWFIDNLYFASAQEPFENHNMWDAHKSGKMYKGNPAGGSANQYVNGLEGIVKASMWQGDYRWDNLGNQAGSRHWSNEAYRVNLDVTDYVGGTGGGFTNTYKATNDFNQGHDGIFMHFSFSSCGVDLHDGTFDGLSTGAQSDTIPGFKENLQWIASSGIMFDWNGDGDYWDDNGQFNEGNNFSYFNANVTAVGLEAHDRQFDPTYTGGPSAAAIINSLTTGNQFKIEGDDFTVYTIQGVDVKYLYNHTPWNHQPYTNSNGQIGTRRDSVAEALEGYRANLTSGYLNKLKTKITDFGKANNRRVCYIVQLDKDPRDAGYNILDNADVDTFNAINFIDTYVQPGSNTLPTSPAILETEAKEDQDLNIYYEISDALPRRLDMTDGTGSSGYSSNWQLGYGQYLEVNIDPHSIKGHLLAPVGTRVTVNNSPADTGEIDYSYQNLAYPNEEFYLRVAAWDGNILTLEGPGLEAKNNDFIDSNNYYGVENGTSGKTLHFWREDGSYTKAQIWRVVALSYNNKYVTHLELIPDVHRRETGLSYYNCFSFGNGVESNRIRDDFNAPTIKHGVKASTTLEEPYEEERRKYGLIYSGLYNSTSGVNNLNQFIQAEKITKDLMPSYGSIQKLYARDKDLVTLCEDKIIQIFVDKDILYNADGNSQLLSTNNVLGTAQPFRGNFGISKNPESFASESFRAYFTDKQRGAVLRLSMDGLTPISDAGMHDFFRDNLSISSRLLGSYDAYKENYNLSITYDYTAINLLIDTIFHQLDPLDDGINNLIYWKRVGDPAELVIHQGSGCLTFLSPEKNVRLEQDTSRHDDTYEVGNKYIVSFTVSEYSGNAGVFVYLINENGGGFITPAVTNNGSHSFNVIIDGDNPLPIIYTRSVFGIGMGDVFVPGVNWIDNDGNKAKVCNLSLVKAPDSGKTISFNEKSGGWISFKSFVPEFGLSCVNQYYTMDNGELWKHHTNETRNNFFDQQYESSITPILNAQPELVKNFNTLNYEGSQSRVDEFITHDMFAPQTSPIGSNLVGYNNATLFAIDNSNAEITTTNNSFIFTELHGEEINTVDESDLITVALNDLDTSKTYRLSFEFNILDLDPESHVYFGIDALINSTSYVGGVYSEDFTPSTPNIQLRVLHPFTEDGYELDVSIEITNFILQELDLATNGNDGEYYNLSSKPGWYIEDIHTNKQDGTLNEFIEKEGKWFNYIKGKSGEVDTAAFNFQGLGIVDTIQ